jgi:adenylosuccinate lyase
MDVLWLGVGGFQAQGPTAAELSALVAGLQRLQICCQGGSRDVAAAIARALAALAKVKPVG